MKIDTKVFVKSSTSYESCPDMDFPEYAFIGRSNVGKSSLINSLINHKNFAKISSKPGKTKLINHFKINNCWYLADLPGFGYAKVSKSMREEFLKMIYDYLKKRKNISCVFMLIDSRLKPQKIDQENMIWLAEHQIPFIMVFTKIDKLNKTQLDQNIISYKKFMLKNWVELPKIILTSSKKNKGLLELKNYINYLNSKLKNV